MEKLYMNKTEAAKLRKGTKEDFANPNGTKKLNTVFYHQSYYGLMETKKHHFKENTNMYEFKTLYAAGQIFVDRQ